MGGFDVAGGERGVGVGQGPSVARRRWRDARRPLGDIAIGLVVGTSLTAAVGTRSTTPRPPRADAPTVVHPREAQRLLDAWRRSRETTWAVTARLRRRTVAGLEVDQDVRRAQRPPDWLSEGFGTVDARRGDRVLRCVSAPSGARTCSDTGQAPPYAQEVDEEVARLRRIVAGSSPLYAVRVRGDCFDLRLITAYPSPPYGERATLCFDAATGAPTNSEVHRPEGDDVRQTLDVRAAVTDADLSPG